MHQYTADLANRMARAGHDVHLVTTHHLPRDRYAPGVTIHTPVATADTGLSLDALRPAAIRPAFSILRHLCPDLVHFTGPHLWNPLILRSLRRAGVPTVHTIHDMHPHRGTAYGRLLYPWNAWVRREAGHLLVHGQRYREELLARGMAPSRVTCTLLTHLFVGHARERALVQSPPVVRYEPWALFLGRLEAYKGLDVLVEAARRLDQHQVASQAVASRLAGIVIAGPGKLGNLVRGQVPANVRVCNELVRDEAAIDLFRRCGLVVLPYIEASQSALVAAAYCFRKPVIVTHTGALPEYVVSGETGWVITPGDPGVLADTLRAALGDLARLASMGEAGRAWYERQRQAEGTTIQTLYASLLTAHNSDP
jgi:glycosyltransferase involved in cell wall biosynthesis